MTLVPAVQDRVASLTGSNRHILTDGTDDVEFSAIISRSWSGEVAITSYTVEDGGTVSDHARPAPPTVSFQGQLTIDDPLGGSGFFSPSVEELLTRLKTWRLTGERLQLIGPDIDLESYVISSFTEEPGDAQESVLVTISMTYVRIAKSSERSLALPQAQRPARAGGRATTATESVPGNAAARPSSALFSAVN